MNQPSGQCDSDEGPGDQDVTLGQSFMASPPFLDIESLLAPIPGDNPAGDTVPFEVRQKLEEDRKEINPEDYGPNDPMRPSEPKRADWPGIIKNATETLAKTSKDLLVAARLTEALTRQHGFGGLRDGLRLLRRLTDDCWDRLHPAIEDGDVEGRLSPFLWLDEADRGARFPSTLSLMPMIPGAERDYSCLDWRRSQKGEGNVPPDEIEKAIATVEPQHCQDQLEDIQTALEDLSQLAFSLDKRIGASAPGLNGIRQALEGCAVLARYLVERRALQTGAAPFTADLGAGQSGAAVGPDRVAATRDEAYRQLAQAAQLLKRLEPHSPIPYLIEKAVTLGALSFPMLIRELIRDSNVLGELNRELGIKEEQSSG